MARILIVDDEPSIVECLRDLLESRGHFVLEAGCLSDAVTIVRSSAIEVAFIDGQFPRNEGDRTTGNFGPLLSKQARTLGVRTILISANLDLTEAERSAGFEALDKPFRLVDVLGAVAEAALAGSAV